jgi:hypothetical protein
MRKTWLTLLFIIVVSDSVTAQVQTFTRDSVAYALDLPSASWRPVSRVDVHDHVEFINGDDATNGYLRIQKRLVTSGATAADLFREAEKWELQRLAGYVVCSGGSGTEINGHHKGTMFSYEFVEKGRTMEGRIYYLEVDKRTFYILHFTVASEKLASLRDQMDFVARSFRLKANG